MFDGRRRQERNLSLSITIPMIHKIIGGGVGMTIEGAIKLAREEVAPIDDIRSTGSYRRHVAGVMLKRFLINA